MNSPAFLFFKLRLQKRMTRNEKSTVQKRSIPCSWFCSRKPSSIFHQVPERVDVGGDTTAVCMHCKSIDLNLEQITCDAELELQQPWMAPLLHSKCCQASQVLAELFRSTRYALNKLRFCMANKRRIFCSSCSTDFAGMQNEHQKFLISII